MTETIVSPIATVDQLVADLLPSIEGELSTASRVVDALLDIRNLARTEAVRTAVDDALANLPGRTAIANPWFLDQLHQLRTLDSQ
ncbi:MAG: hypothetical protein KDB21_09135 [Acidimicrobiales bacterium]|nr:hypothetical protein [Acidimicrobiales bacterium]